jgi:S-adenosylmethionine:tRNA ribosyltransferase-isomerase
MRTNDFDYDLPLERIAQTPIEPRHASRLMVMRRDRDDLEHSTFWQVGDYLRPGDVLVINQTQVIPARIFARKASGGKVELLLLRRQDACTWEALVGGKGLLAGVQLGLDNGQSATVEVMLEGSRRLLRFSEPVEPYLEMKGEMPLPPYIHTPLADPGRYQTVYAAQRGSAAAPTAGLHFTRELMQKLEAQGIHFVRLTLHVGLDTFAPVKEEDPVQHAIHTEWCELTPHAAQEINRARCEGGRVVAVGTTSVRTLETAARVADTGETVGAFSGPTGLYILPGFRFQAVDVMITNFHLPRSSLIMLVSAFSGRERVLAAYREAIRLQYRFYSFGDAMLIV